MELFNNIVFILFTVCYCYQFIYIPIAWYGQKPPKSAAQDKRYAALICARNEESVIGELIGSLKRQTYPITVFVCADNCDDDTAGVATRAGATVFTRRSDTLVGKGYALETLLKSIDIESFDGFFVFDADNILPRDYVEKMHNTFCEGHDIVTGYRNSRNYGDNWISAGYALWFLRESRYLNYPRHLVGSSCAVSGTGFMFSREVAREGWRFHMLTEDIEFSVHSIVNGRRIAFCREAELYDEQPTRFSQSWYQRLRWSKGFLQVFRGYGGRLLRGMAGGSFACFDIAASIMPAFVLSSISLIANTVYAFFDLRAAVLSLLTAALNVYLTLFVIGAVTTFTEWRHIHEPIYKKLIYIFTFPIFMATYLPISLTALFCKVTWRPITHTRATAKQKTNIE